jgi:hypothetical protein
MTGVEILTMEEVATQYGFNWATVLISGGIIALICTLAIAVFVISPVDWEDWLFCITIGLLVGALFGALFGCINQTPVDYETQYKVSISDEVQLNEFNEKYEIIEQDGKIYTVRERE